MLVSYLAMILGKRGDPTVFPWLWQAFKTLEHNPEFFMGPILGLRYLHERFPNKKFEIFIATHPIHENRNNTFLNHSWNMSKIQIIKTFTKFNRWILSNEECKF